METAEAAASTQRGDPYLIGQICQLILTAIIAGVLRRLLSDTRALVLGRGRTFAHAPAEHPAADPLIQQVLGEISSAAFSAEAIVLAAADAQDKALLARGDGSGFEAAHAGSIAAAQAKVVVDALAQKAANQLFEAGGASAVRASRGLHRHWLDIRTLSSHNPTIYKARALGDWTLNGTLLPNTGFF